LPLLFSLSIGGFAYFITISLTTDIEVVWGERKVGGSPPTQARLLYGSPAVLTIHIKANTQRAGGVFDNFLNRSGDTR